MSLSTPLIRSLFALPLLAVSLVALALPEAPPSAAASIRIVLSDASDCAVPSRPMRPLPLTQVPADLGARLRIVLPGCRS